MLIARASSSEGEYFVFRNSPKSSLVVFVLTALRFVLCFLSMMISLISAITT